MQGSGSRTNHLHSDGSLVCNIDSIWGFDLCSWSSSVLLFLHGGSSVFSTVFESFSLPLVLFMSFMHCCVL